MKTLFMPKSEIIAAVTGPGLKGVQRLCLDQVPKILGISFTALLWIAIGYASASAAIQEATLPSLDTLHAGHPRLLIHKNAWKQAKDVIDADADARKRHEGILRNAASILKNSPSQYELPDGRRLLSVSRKVLDRSMTLAYAFRMTGDKRYRMRLAEEMKAVCRFPDWNHHTHYLDVAEMAYAVAIAYDWLFDEWSGEERREMRGALRSFAIDPTLDVYRGKVRQSWLTSTSNWNFVCNGGILAAALAIAEPGQNQPDLEEVLRSSFKSVRPAYRTYEPDGAWPEGPAYWKYATMYAVAYVALLDSALGGTGGLDENPAFMQTVWSQLWHTGPSGRSFNYADSGRGVAGCQYALWLARRTGQPGMAFYHFVTGRGRYRLWPSPLDILWHVPAEEYRGAIGGLPHAKFIGRVNAFVYRESWEDPDAFYIAMQAGSNEEGHAHLDVGTFVMDAYGERWALDLGSERQTYLVHQYPKKERPSRWDFYRLRAEGHNTLVLNPGRGPDQNPKGAGRKIRFESTPDGLIGIADLTGVYGKEASRVWRGIRVADRRKAVIQDEVILKQPGELWWFLHTEHAVKASKDGQSATLVSKSGKAACDVHLLSPAGARLQVMDARPLPTTADPSKQNQNENIYKLAIHLEDVKKATIAVSLIPRKQNAASVNPYDKVIEPLDEW